MREKQVETRSIGPADRAWVRSMLVDRWGGVEIISRGTQHDALALPGFIAIRGDVRLGLATVSFQDDQCELVTLDALQPNVGIGTRLLAAVITEARVRISSRLWLVTTNDNLDAMRFYFRRSFRIAAVHLGAVERARAMKPSIPHIGCHGLPIRDEVELELSLKDDSPEKSGAGKV